MNPVSDIRYAATDRLADADKDVRGYSWRPSIHMPRWASRLTLIVTATKIERLQDISEEDAKTEGVEGWSGEWFETSLGCIKSANVPAKTQFAGLWMHLHGVDSWRANPEVVALTFRVVQQNIDAIKENTHG